MHVKLLTSQDQLAALQQPWQRLPLCAPFRGWEWLAPFWQHYGSQRGAELYSLACFDAETLVAVAPWYRQRTPLGRVVRALGDGEICSDYLGIPCAVGREAEVAEVLARYLTTARAAAGWELLQLEAQDSSDPVLSALAARLHGRGHAVSDLVGPRCWRIELPPSESLVEPAPEMDIQLRWDAYLGTLSRSHRSQTRRIARRCQTLHAELRVVHTASELPAAFALLVQLHQRRRNQLGDPGLFAAPQMLRFHREAAEQLLAAGRLWLAWLEVQGRPLAAQYGARDKQTLYVYQSGIEPAELELEPGRMMLVASLRYALAHGIRGVDLLRGDEPYKSHFRAVPRPARELIIAHRHLSGRLGYHALTGSLRLRAWARELRRFLDQRLRPAPQLPEPPAKP